MKTRNALVSNSSSASFICYWRCLNMIGDEPMNKEEAIKGLMQEFNDVELDEVTKEMIKNTTNTGSKGTFKTHGHTIMYNSVLDIPSHITHLVVALEIEKGYELIDLKVDCDGG